ncbi:N-glycosylation protein EOS1 [Apiospora rasikravindrae]|uniref:N-glycosylation protein EOS1 n=1 Tax=Apiospora rasikravindrae TaxID=990691 RepID=A0ABR1S1D2_9PEZI
MATLFSRSWTSQPNGSSNSAHTKSHTNSHRPPSSSRYEQLQQQDGFVAITRTSSHDENPNNNYNGHHLRNSPVVRAGFMQPRIAVVLDVPRVWHPFLFICRLQSIAPALWWGLRCALRFLISDFLQSRDIAQFLGLDYGSSGGSGILDSASDAARRQVRTEQRLRLTETALSMIWCGAGAYLAFIFTDSLMSRWLLNYTPQATIVRLFALTGIYFYVSSWTVYLLGGSDDPSMLLPAWIGIATTLTACYHVSQRKINIRKETSASISIFSIASFISMAALLSHHHINRLEYPDVPLFGVLQKAAELGGWIVVKVLDVRDRDGL